MTRGRGEGMARLGPLSDGLDAVRWAGDAPVMVPDPPINWRGMPLLCHDLNCLEDEWTCKYCGKVNPASALACGEGVWDGCGASRPEYEEPPRGVLHLPPNIPIHTFRNSEQAGPHWREALAPDFYPEPSMTVTHPGKTAKEHKQEIGARLVSAFQKAIRGARSLC